MGGNLVKQVRTLESVEGGGVVVEATRNVVCNLYLVFGSRPAQVQ